MHTSRRLISGFLTALAGAQLALWLHLPLPWLLGPLLLTAACSSRGWPVDSHPIFRNAGQWCIGTSLGLYFTPAMLGVVAANIPAISAAVVFAVLLGGCGAAAYCRFGGVDFKTAWFASAIGGASEMANLAAHHQAQVDKVVSAHSLRVLLVVLIIPFAYQFAGIHGLDDGAAFGKNPHIDYGGFLALIGWTALFGWAFKQLGWINPWVFGPLLAAIILTAQNIHLSAIPTPLQYLGQLFIGWSLGCKFTPGFFRRAPRFLTAVALVTLIGLLLTTLAAWCVSHASGLHYPTVLLGMSPGGIAEMTITAKALQLGVPLVTVFHVCRMVCVLLSTGTLYRLLAKHINS
ncbi:AbrB family transcriptional regulator [Uruburuella testudinis]|uniref:AbrB family transcriptional regulator n=1 Tax=Uruburuella testudinis TaxID=1282863 RepID=A0ABY4DRM4_9NEIS|nr:AbrB family transcriptional regulator [Uruburuella testudinis]UOO81680.1 AbrB family transcriptional regulator [Uruburuella testudinis]